MMKVQQSIGQIGWERIFTIKVTKQNGKHDMNLNIFTFNPFAENTYVISDGTSSCTIIDPGCYDQSEFAIMDQYIQDKGLKPSKIVLTHAHLDHIFGLKRCLDAYEVDFYMQDLEKPVLDSSPAVAGMYGVQCDAVTSDHISLKAGSTIEMGGVPWTILFTPGHSPGSVCFYHEESQHLIGGDVLFRDSIGRTDLPGGDHTTLLNSISEKLYVLPDETTVFPGHGPSTTIGYERMNNPFVRG